MTDQDVPDFDDPSYDAVRGLLAGARSTEPVPADVAARLEATLADLTSDRSSGPDGSGSVGTTTDVLPFRRRSRLATRLLVAAAAVVVVGAGGIGLAQVLGDNGAGSASTTAAADRPAATAQGQAPAAQTPAGQTPAAQTPADQTPGAPEAGLPQLTTADFAADAKRYTTQERLRRSANELKSLTAGPDQDSADVPRPAAPDVNGPATGYAADQGTSGSAAGKTGSESTLGSLTGASCAGPVGTDAEVTPIVLDGAPAALAVHPVKDGLQLIEAWSCDGRSVLVATSVAR
ncbi:MAG: hypothetical protein JWQ74_2004 [Marmoricola sp.]|nr:hypothetical protein [Marmoricola sp.]